MKDKRRERVTWAHGEGGAKSHAFLRFLSRDAGKVGEGGKELPPSTFTETIGPGPRVGFTAYSGYFQARRQISNHSLSRSLSIDPALCLQKAESSAAPRVGVVV